MHPGPAAHRENESRAADSEIEKLDEKHLDAELAKLKEKVPIGKPRAPTHSIIASAR